MGWVSGYECDAFVSYSHIDNQPFSVPERRWVEVFHGHLQNFVDVHLGAHATIWRDARLTGAEVFSDEIHRQLLASAALVPILSPGYMNSDWCRKELVGFADAAQARGGLQVGSLHRVLKVLRLPVERTALLPILDTTLGTSFFRVDEQSKRARDLLVDPAPDAMQVFLARVDDVAQDLARLLRAMMPPHDGDPAGGVQAPPPAGRVVYLAWTSGDLAAERDQLRRELEARQHRVVPDTEAPLDAANFRAAVQAALAQADLAVHMVGDRYGLVPEGESRSIVELQLDDAVFQASGGRAARVIWLSPQAQAQPASDPRLAALLAGVQHRSVDVLSNQSVEVLKSLVLDRLKPAAAPAPAFAAASATSAAGVYLLCDRLDREDVAPIRRFLFERSLEVRLPLFEGDAQDIRADHYESLKECDGVFVYWGRGSERWLRTMLRDLKKVFGLGRERPFKARVLMLGGPPDVGKQVFVTHELPVVAAGSAFAAELLLPFMAEVGVAP